MADVSTKNEKTINALTIDVEDYWAIFNRDWLGIDSEPSDAVVRNTEWFLQTLAEYNTKATFFILGEVAQKFPSLVKKIAQAGHEIAAHGFSHKQIFKLTEQQFRAEVSDCKKLLEDITSQAVLGHRAPAFSIMPDTRWALETLAEVGFRYDSSVFPISSRRYGWPGFSRDICRVNVCGGQSIIEVPMSTVKIFGETIPAAGGGYIRHFPYAFTRWAITRIQKQRPAIVYMHPYEIDTEPKTFHFNNLNPADKLKALKFHIAQLQNRKTVRKKLVKLLADFDFTKLAEIIKNI
jgi:polysaccharide deacetylase family protein (PEP-CTERM system associated)